MGLFRLAPKCARPPALPERRQMYSIELCEVPPEREAMDALLQAYYDLMIDRLKSVGAEAEDEGQIAIAEFWAEIRKVMPPEGRLYVARDAVGALVGTGSLKRVGADQGELKRLFVRSEARGSGLGRRLVLQRIEDAKAMGLRELIVDTLSPNVEMRRLYASLGFEECAPFEESSTVRMAPQLLPHMVFFRKEV